jgi:hypothetical protein
LWRYIINSSTSEENRTSAKIKINNLVDVLEQTISFTGAEISANLKWLIRSKWRQVKSHNNNNSSGTSKELYFHTNNSKCFGTWQNIFVQFQ